MSTLEAYVSDLEQETMAALLKRKPTKIITNCYEQGYNICIGEYVPVISLPTFHTWLHDEMKKEFSEMDNETFNIKFDELIELISVGRTWDDVHAWVEQKGYTREFETNDLIFHYTGNMFGPSEFCDNFKNKFGSFIMHSAELYLNRVFIGHVVCFFGKEDDSKIEEDDDSPSVLISNRIHELFEQFQTPDEKSYLEHYPVYDAWKLILDEVYGEQMMKMQQRYPTLFPDGAKYIVIPAIEGEGD